MRILYVSTVCSDRFFAEIYNKSRMKPQQQAQKFHSLLTKGLSKWVDNITMLTRTPVRIEETSITLSTYHEKIDNREYHYIKPKRNKFYNVINMAYYSFVTTFKWGLRNRKYDCVIYYDILNLSISMSALIASKILRVKSVAIVTDLPNYVNLSNRHNLKKTKIINRLYEFISNAYLYSFDSYVILTEQMNGKVNKNNKPYVVVEGLVDEDMSLIDNFNESKYKDKIVMYSGALYEKYGIKMLLDAFTRIKDDSVRLWLFGEGDMRDSIENYTTVDPRIKYFGVKPNTEIIELQQKVKLLINPRPTNEEFTKYSFPSKNMEYMLSGTPLLTTKLPGMPKEYEEYVYLVEDETVEGLSLKIHQILSLPNDVLNEKGKNARRFVLEHKNNNIQAKKILSEV